MLIRILKPVGVIAPHHFFGTVPAVHFQPEKDFVLAFASPYQRIQDAIKERRFRPTFQDLNIWVRCLQPRPPSSQHASVTLIGDARWRIGIPRDVFKMNTLGDIPRTMCQPQSLGADRVSLVFADLSALDQMLRLKLHQKISNMTLAETCQRSDFRSIGCLEPCYDL